MKRMKPQDAAAVPNAAAPGTEGTLSDMHLLARHLGPQRGRILILAVIIFSAIGLQLLAPWLFGRFVRLIQAQRTTADVALVGVQFVLTALTLQVVNVQAAALSARVAWEATNTLRLNLTAHVLHLDPAFHKAHTPGALLERVDADAGTLGNFFSRLTLDLLGNVLLVAGTILILLRIEWHVGLSTAVFVTLTLTLLLLMRGPARAGWLEVRRLETQFTGFVGETLQAREEIRTNGRGAFVMELFHRHLRAWLEQRYHYKLLFAVNWSLPVLLFAAGDAMAFLLSAHLHARGRIDAGTAVSIFFYVALLARPVEQIRAQLQNLQQVDASLSRIRALLQERPGHQGGEAQLPEQPLPVTFRDVTFQYGDGPPALNGVSFHVPAGRTLAIVGRSGSGKTTIARLLFGLYVPQEGQIHLGEHPLQTVSVRALRSHVALVTQDVQLFSASVRDNVTLFDETVSVARVEQVLDEVGLSAWVTGLPDGLHSLIEPASLSAGQAQLLALARLQLTSPHLIILDEASSRLDRATETQVTAALQRVLHGKTVIIIAHRLSAITWADDLLMLGDGRTLEFGPVSALARDPRSAFYALSAAAREEVSG